MRSVQQCGLLKHVAPHDPEPVPVADPESLAVCQVRGLLHAVELSRQLSA